MSLYTQLQQRAADKKPIRVGLIGAGKFGSMYLSQVVRTVKPGGHVLVATFGLDGPEKCSGLPVARYDAPGIHAVFGDAFEKVGEAAEQHATPWGSVQSFVYCFCHRRA